MPLNLDTTAPLVGRRPKRRWTLLVVGHGRWRYLERAISALDLDRFDRRVLSVDGPDVGPYGAYFDAMYHTGARSGLSANLKQAWGALKADDEWVLHVEEDMVVHDAPLEAMAEILEVNPTVCQMALVRQPWSPEEAHAGGLLWGPHFKGEFNYRGGWMEHRKIFTLNPFVAHAEFLRSLRPSVESDLTGQCLERGLSFGMWGSPTDPPRVEHIGAEGGMGSPGWRP